MSEFDAQRVAERIDIVLDILCGRRLPLCDP